MSAPKRPGSTPFIAKEEMAATAPHTYPPPEDAPPLQRRVMGSRPDAPFEDLKSRTDNHATKLEEIQDELDRISTVHAEPKMTIERAELEERAERVRYHRAWNKLGLKIGGSIAVIFGAAALVSVIWAKAVVEPKLDKTKVVQSLQNSDFENLQTRLTTLETYRRLKYNRDLCIQAMIHSAFARGTGHELSPLIDPGVHWASDSMPKLQLRVTWDTTPFFPITQCPPEPIPPGCTPSGCQ